MKAFSICLAAAVLTVSAAVAQQTLTTSPEAVTFTTQEQVASVQVLKSGRPVEIDRVRGYQFLVGKNTYGHMITVKAENENIRIKPTEQLEVGTYTLAVNTNAGRVLIDVRAPLSGMSDSLQARAERAGVAPETMKQMLGLASANPREAVAFTLPQRYYEGQTLVLTMKEHPDRYYTWAVNGEVVEEGLGKNELVYTFKEPGDYLISYTERENGNIIAAAAGDTIVEPIPAVAIEMPAYSEFVARAPDGYRRYAWRSNGATIGNGREVRYRLNEPGIYEVEVLSEDPMTGRPGQFSRTRYRIVAR